MRSAKNTFIRDWYGTSLLLASIFNSSIIISGNRREIFFVESGMDITLTGRKGSHIYAKKADGDFEAHLVALSCSDPPEGFARWSLRLLADQVVQLEYIDTVSHETIRQVLKKRT